MDVYAIDETGKYGPWIKFGLLCEDEIYVSLTSARHTPDSCIQAITIKWVEHFCDHTLAPRIELQSGQLKFVALYPQLISVFLRMKDGVMSMQSVLDELSKYGVRDDGGRKLTCCDAIVERDSLVDDGEYICSECNFSNKDERHITYCPNSPPLRIYQAD